jgi:hypothetical protein
VIFVDNEIGPIAVYVLDLERRSNGNVVLHLVSNAVTKREKILFLPENWSTTTQFPEQNLFYEQQV